MLVKVEGPHETFGINLLLLEMRRATKVWRRAMNCSTATNGLASSPGLPMPWLAASCLHFSRCLCLLPPEEIQEADLWVTSGYCVLNNGDLGGDGEGEGARAVTVHHREADFNLLDNRPAITRAA